jgi:formate dehydrogenase maturation protein FdhE
MSVSDDFQFSYCPECGSDSLSSGWIFPGAGYIRKCDSCGKTWHVIREE